MAEGRAAAQVTPVLLAALIACVAALVPMGQRLLQQNPLEPWEAAITVEGARRAEALPVYVSAATDAPSQGRATHMYGPGLQEILGVVFRAIEPDVRVARLLSLIAAAALLGLVLRMTQAGVAVATFLPYAALFLGVDGLTGGYFVNGKPDLLALALAAAAVAVHLRALARHSVAGVGAAALLAVAALLCKQNLAALVLAVPAGYAGNVLLRREPLRLRTLLLAAAPSLAVAGAVGILRFGFPLAFGYLIELPGACPIYPSRWWGFAAAALLSPPVLLLLAAMAAGRARALAGCETAYWGAALLVAFAMSTLSAAKLGGGFNSLLCFEAVACAAAIRALERWDWTRHLGTPRPGYVAAAALLAAAFPHPGNTHPVPHYADHSADYAEAAGVIAGLQGAVLSPEDPTLLLRPGTDPGWNIYLEADRSILSGARHGDRVARDERALLGAATAVVDVQFGFVGADYDLIRPESLSSLGFRRTWSNASYALWQRPG
ncbi:MAG TPA: hypothetical protein VM369_05155 [Candidatus Binatia bacterium]|nr:hypothetical protein [Candidatus Binatia bacterium]